MTDILVRDVPPDLRQQIAERARQNNRSLSREIEHLLRGALMAAGQPVAKPRTGADLRAQLVGMISRDDWAEALIQSRDEPDRPLPEFE